MRDDAGLEQDLYLRAEIKVYYDLYIPERLSTPAPLLISVHGYGAHKRYMMREARAVAGDNWVIASIEAPHSHYRQTADGYRVGYGWLTDSRSENDVALHHQFVSDLIETLDERDLIDRSRIAMFGFSQACALNFRFAFTYPDVLSAIAGVCGGIPGDLSTNKLYRPFVAETLYMYGDDDEFYTQEQFADFDKKLAAMLPRYRSIQYRAGHEITNEMREDLAQFFLGVQL